MGDLVLIRSSREEDRQINVRRVSSYIAGVIAADPKVPLRSAIESDCFELWYWFDPIRLEHIILVFADFSDYRLPNDDPCQPYCQAPIRLFARLLQSQSEDYPLTTGELVWYLESPTEQLPLRDRPPMSRLAQEYLLEREEFKKSLERAGINESEDFPNSVLGEDWTILLVFLTWFNRIPAVPIKRAAKLLNVEEKTIRNRVERKELEAIPRQGAIWITLRSIKHYLKTNYHATATFDLWSDIEKELRKKL